MAIAGHQPADILTELARVSEWATNGKYATMAAAILEPDVSRLTYATAGHPPILFRRANHWYGGDPPRRRGAKPLSVAGDDAYPCSAPGHRRPGRRRYLASVYTDGLIERRGEDEYPPRAWPLACSSRVCWRPGMPLDEAVDRLVGSLATEPQQDDMCVLAVCRTP